MNFPFIGIGIFFIRNIKAERVLLFYFNIIFNLKNKIFNPSFIHSFLFKFNKLIIYFYNQIGIGTTAPPVAIATPKPIKINDKFIEEYSLKKLAFKNSKTFSNPS